MWEICEIRFLQKKQWRWKYEKLGGAECRYIAGTRIVREAHSEHAKHAGSLSRGVWGHAPPGKF